MQNELGILSDLKKQKKNNEHVLFRSYVYMISTVLVISILLLAVWVSRVSAEQDRRTLPIQSIQNKMLNSVFEKD